MRTADELLKAANVWLRLLATGIDPVTTNISVHAKGPEGSRELVSINLQESLDEIEAYLSNLEGSGK